MNADDYLHDSSNSDEVEACENDGKLDCHRMGADYKSCISNAVNNVLEGKFLRFKFFLYRYFKLYR